LISGGENVYCAEVENTIAGHPDVVEVAVIGRADEKWGEVPVAVLVQKEGTADLTLEQVNEWLQNKLAAFKRPKHLVLVAELPRNASGKVVKGTRRSEHGSVGGCPGGGHDLPPAHRPRPGRRPLRPGRLAGRLLGVHARQLRAHRRDRQALADRDAGPGAVHRAGVLGAGTAAHASGRCARGRLGG